jgi:hypothetical protein
MSAPMPKQEQEGRILIINKGDIQKLSWPPAIPVEDLNIEEFVPGKVFTKTDYLHALPILKNIVRIEWGSGPAEYLLTDFAYGLRVGSYQSFWLWVRDPRGKEQYQCFACKLLSRAGSG